MKDYPLVEIALSKIRLCRTSPQHFTLRDGSVEIVVKDAKQVLFPKLIPEVENVKDAKQVLFPKLIPEVENAKDAKQVSFPKLFPEVENAKGQR